MAIVPLGGDGFVAPKFAYAIADLNVVGDASGGNADITVIMDPRYTSLVAFMTASDIQVASADADVRMFVTGVGVPTQVDQVPVTAISATVAGRTVSRTWTPTPFVLPGGTLPISRLTLRMLNVLNDSYFLDAWVYCFDIRVREVTPMGPLLWARGAT